MMPNQSVQKRRVPDSSLEGLRKGREGRKAIAKAQWKAEGKTCPSCGDPLPYEKRKNTFCNHSCAASYNNQGVKRHGESPVKTQCPVCGKLVSRTYCSPECQHEQQYRDYIERWLEGKESGLRKGGRVSVHIRRWLFEQYDNRCAVCGWGERNPYSGTIPLQVEHIDGKWRNCRPENLTLLCPNCHSMTPTYMALNKGNAKGKPRDIRTRHTAEVPRTREDKALCVMIPCAYCGTPNEYVVSRVKYVKRQGQKNFFCNSLCAGKYNGFQKKT